MSSPEPRAKAAHRARHRYLLVRLEPGPGPPRETLVRRLQAVAPRELGLWLTRYDGSFGIVRVRREHAAAARAFLEAPAEVSLRPVLTSGSIAGLRRKHRGARALLQGPR